MNGKGKITEMTWAELSKLRSTQFQKPIPRLDEVLAHYAPLESITTKTNTVFPKLMIELKGDNVVELAAALIQKQADTSRIVLSSHHLKYLTEIHNLLPTIPLCLNITACREFTITDLLKTSSIDALPLPFAMISLHSMIVSTKFITKCHELKILALAWDFVSPLFPKLRIKKCLNKKIDGLLLDSPNQVKLVPNSTEQ
jgi:glycerophosphoryl diester phosphodiesterase